MACRGLVGEAEDILADPNLSHERGDAQVPASLGYGAADMLTQL
jgi:hypothetical protein